MEMNARANSLHSLLVENSRQLENFKFFPGTRQGVSAGELCLAAKQAINSALSKGLKDNSPKTGRVKTTI